MIRKSNNKFESQNTHKYTEYHRFIYIYFTYNTLRVFQSLNFKSIDTQNLFEKNIEIQKHFKNFD